MSILTLEEQLAEEALNQERAKTSLILAEKSELQMDRDNARHERNAWGKLVRDRLQVIVTVAVVGAAVVGAGWGISWMEEQSPSDPCVELYEEDHHDLPPSNSADPELECEHPDHIIVREEETITWGEKGEEPEGTRRVKLTCQCPLARAKHKGDPPAVPEPPSRRTQ